MGNSNEPTSEVETPTATQRVEQMDIGQLAGHLETLTSTAADLLQGKQGAIAESLRAAGVEAAKRLRAQATATKTKWRDVCGPD